MYRSGFSKRGGRPYAFWGCDGFRNGCNNTLTPQEYSALESKGTAQLDPAMNKAARTWADPQHKSYRPRQRFNANQAAQVDYRLMTDEQENIIQRLQHGKVMMRIRAGAGTGKSSVSRQAAARIHPLKGEFTTGILLSFGKRAAQEQVLPFNWVSGTVHSSGNDSVAAYFGVKKRNPNEYKIKNILRDEYGKMTDETATLYSAVEGIVEMIQGLALPLDVDDATIFHYAELYNTNLGDVPAETATYARTVLKIGSSRAGIVKYGHTFAEMVYLPVVLNLPVAKYRYVGVDEYQDSSPARIALAMMMTDETLFVVGDEHQNIFGFTYAAMDAMQRFSDLVGGRCEDFPLTMNWRCPTQIIALAQLLDPSLRARPNAPKGAVHEISDDQFYRIVRAGDLVLCRVNADLIHAAYELIKAGIGAVVLGRDIGIRLKNIIMRLGQTSEPGEYIRTDAFLVNLNAWYDAEQEIIAAKNVRNPDKLFNDLDDDYSCILALCGVQIDNNAACAIEITTVQGVLDKIDEMFGEATDEGFDPARVVTLATIHKMKGGQCARVFDLRANENHPHPMAISDWEQEQEKWVLHVAITRTGDGSDKEGQAFFFVGGMPAMLEALGGRQFIESYTGAMR